MSSDPKFLMGFLTIWYYYKIYYFAKHNLKLYHDLLFCKNLTQIQKSIKNNILPYSYFPRIIKYNILLYSFPSTVLKKRNPYQLQSHSLPFHSTNMILKSKLLPRKVVCHYGSSHGHLLTC